jgi:uncharacterized membrane protein
MNGVHIHLLLNHIPVIGIAIGLVIFGLGVWRRNDSWTRLALGLFVVVALASLATMLTGEGAEEAVERLPGVTDAIIEPHEDAAQLASIAAYVLGATSLAGLILMRHRVVPRALTMIVLPMVLLVAGLMAYTANLGGQIRHTEIRAGAVVEADGDGGRGEREIEH